MPETKADMPTRTRRQEPSAVPVVVTVMQGPQTRSILGIPIRLTSETPDHPAERAPADVRVVAFVITKDGRLLDGEGESHTTMLFAHLPAEWDGEMCCAWRDRHQTSSGFVIGAKAYWWEVPSDQDAERLLSRYDVAEFICYEPL